MTTLISFLGAGPLHETTYVYGEQRHTSCYMADAAVRFFHPQRLLVVVTAQAREMHFEALRTSLGETIDPEPVDIPSGQDAAGQWAIFSAIAERIQPEDRLVFDLTNGFRSIPVLVLLIAAHVRLVRRARVEHLIYGAFDARNKESNETPVFDLTPLVSLLEWTTATDAFLSYGRADALQRLVNPDDSQTASSAAAQLAHRLHELTAALQTSRPAEVMAKASQLPTDLAAFRASGTLDAAAGPLGLLLNTIEHEYGRMAHPSPHDHKLAREVIVKQLEMIEWYASKQLYVQAFTLTREWLVSVALAADDGEYDLYNERDRKLAEAAVNGFAQTNERQPRTVPSPVLAAGRLPAMRGLWDRCGKLRNDIAHAGMRRNASIAEYVEREVQAVCADLRPALRELGYDV